MCLGGLEVTPKAHSGILASRQMATKGLHLWFFFVAINSLESGMAVEAIQTMAGPHLNLEPNPGDVGHQGFGKPQQSSLLPFLSP